MGTRLHLRKVMRNVGGGRDARFGIAHYLAALGVVTLVSVGLVEIAVRLMELAPRLPDEYSKFREMRHLPYGIQPNAVISGTKEEFSYRYVHNSLGF